MATRNRNHAFAANPLLGAAASDSSAVATIENLLQKSGEEQTGIEQSIRIVPFRQGKPLVLSSSSSSSSSDEAPVWRLSWQNLQKCRELLGSSEVELVRLGQREGIVYWALDLTEIDHSQSEFESESGKCAFVHLRTLMVGTDWSDGNAMEDLSIAGHARAMLEWNSLSRFCGKCGTKTIPIDAGRRRQCGNSSCKKKIYPRVDPPGESLEEVGIAVGEVVYHSSQPWPVEVLDVRGLKKLVLSFEQRLRDTLEARMKYADHPNKFVDLEVELHEEITKQKALTGALDLFSELVHLNTILSILRLLSHENIDIVVDVINLFQDLMDEDVLEDSDEAAQVLIDALGENNALELLVQNLNQLDENGLDETTTIYNTLAEPSVLQVVALYKSRDPKS